MTIDIGNTNVVMGLYEDGKLDTHWRVATEHRKMADEYAMLLLNLFERSDQSPTTVEGVIISSVVPPLTGIFAKLAERYFYQTPLIVRAGTKTGVPNGSDGSTREATQISRPPSPPGRVE